MPYIKPKDREKFKEFLEKLPVPENAGELNYLITSLIDKCLRNTDINYQVLNDILGALEGAKQEFYRRFVQDFEEEKIQQNGDIEAYKKKNETT